MNAANIVLIDLNPSARVGSALREIVESCQKLNACVRYESSPDRQSVSCDSVLANSIAHCQPDLIIFVLSRCDLKRASEMIRFARIKFSELPILFIADKCRPDEMFALLRQGATDFLTPPAKDTEILPRLWRQLEHTQEKNTITYRLKEKLGLRQLVGESPTFLDEIKKIPVVAGCDAGVLITGETGTGKELCARAIHYLSPRSSKPFISFNCGAIPNDLIENELFGHVQGAFTGASASHPGLIDAANGGTLFLDDIDCFPLASQAKLLHFLQEKEYRQLGSAKMYQADVRVVAATNTDLEAAVEEGKFRRDFYYRLNIIPIGLPSLRHRRKDIPLLSRHFLKKYATEFGKQVTGFDSRAMQYLMMYSWPGNVRELEHVIERAVLFCEQTLIKMADIILPREKTPVCSTSFKEAKAAVVTRFEKEYIEKLLNEHRGNITRAAMSAQKNRRAFWQLIRKHQIDVRSFKPG